MNNFSVLIGSLMSILGMGSGLASQGVSIHQQLHPQQAYSAPAAMPGQACKLDRQGSLIDGTFVVVDHGGGVRTLDCVPNAEDSQR
jgi:hypothetical protein